MARIANRPEALRATTQFARLIKETSNRCDYEIEAELTGVKDADGRKFMRWRNGISALTPTKLQKYGRRAVQLGWLPLGRWAGIICPDDVRMGRDPNSLDEQGRIRISAGKRIREQRRLINRLQRAKETVIAALSKLRDAILVSSEVIVFDSAATAGNSRGDLASNLEGAEQITDVDGEFSSADAQQMIDQIDRLCFLDTSPWAANNG